LSPFGSPSARRPTNQVGFWKTLAKELAPKLLLNLSCISLTCQSSAPLGSVLHSFTLFCEAFDGYRHSTRAANQLSRVGSRTTTATTRSTTPHLNRASLAITRLKWDST
jgi:hypothetical protein